MSRYHTAIHTPVFPSQVSGYSSLSGALALPPPEFSSPHRHRVPQLRVCETSESPVCDPIRFDYIGQAGQGVSLADFSVRSQHAIHQLVAGTNDHVLAGTGINKIHLRITVRFCSMSYMVILTCCIVAWLRAPEFCAKYASERCYFTGTAGSEYCYANLVFYGGEFFLF